jgi:predicted GNAT family acetyltransferase
VTAAPPAPLALTFRPVTRETRGDFERLFESPGAPRYCWCMVWRRTSEEAKHHDNNERKAQMKERTPRETYRNLGGPLAEPDEVIWSLACFFVPRKLRGEGTVRTLIAAAVEHARVNGATVVEAYPVDEAAPSYRFMGFVKVFAEAGFAEVGRAGNRRHVMRRTLRRA